MSVILETNVGDITIDLLVKERPRTCLNFLKLCKVKYYNYSPIHNVQKDFIVQCGDPTGTGKGGSSIFSQLYGDQAQYFEGERVPKLKHLQIGTVSMVNNGSDGHGSQFLITTGEKLDYLDGVHTVFAEVVEGEDVLIKINEAICDDENRPYVDLRINHTIILDDPFDDPPNLSVPDRSPAPTKEQLETTRIGVDESLDETEGKTQQELEEEIQSREAKARAQLLEMVGDIPDADIAPPENVLFVCKLNPVTSDDDLEIIFSRFGTIVSCEVIRDQKTAESLQYAFVEFENKADCEKAYFKMDNVLIDDRRIHVDFSQSVSKYRWRGKGRGVTVNKGDGPDVTGNKNSQFKGSSFRGTRGRGAGYRGRGRGFSREGRYSDDEGERPQPAMPLDRWRESGMEQRGREDPRGRVDRNRREAESSNIRRHAERNENSHARGREEDRSENRQARGREEDRSENRRETRVRVEERSEKRREPRGRDEGRSGNRRDMRVREEERSEKRREGRDEDRSENRRDTGVREQEKSEKRREGRDEDRSENRRDTGVREQERSEKRREGRDEDRSANRRDTGVREQERSEKRREGRDEDRRENRHVRGRDEDSSENRREARGQERSGDRKERIRERSEEKQRRKSGDRHDRKEDRRAEGSGRREMSTERQQRDTKRARSSDRTRRGEDVQQDRSHDRRDKSSDRLRDQSHNRRARSRDRQEKSIDKAGETRDDRNRGEETLLRKREHRKVSSDRIDEAKKIRSREDSLEDRLAPKEKKRVEKDRKRKESSASDDSADSSPPKRKSKKSKKKKKKSKKSKKKKHESSSSESRDDSD